MAFPTTLDTITDGATTITAAHTKTLQNMLVGPTVYNVKGAPYLAVGDGVTDDTAKINTAIAVIKAAGRGVLLAPPAVYLVGTAGVYLDFTGVNNVMVYAVGAKFAFPTTGSVKYHMFNFCNCQNVFMYGGESYSNYGGNTWDLLSQLGNGTIVDFKVIRWWFHGDNNNAGQSQPYMADFFPTAVEGNNDLLFDYCRFESTGTAPIQVAGLNIRGFLGLKVQNCTFVNINNPIVPDNNYQDNGLVYAGNYEYTTSLSNFCEGPNPWGVNNITYVNNVQVIKSGLSPTGTSDIGGVLISAGGAGGYVCQDVVIVGNVFEWNPIQFAPSTSGTGAITWVTVKGNSMGCGRSTAFVNGCIILQNDSGATSGHFSIEGNTCHGTFTGAPFQQGTGYTDVSCKDNPGINPQVIQTPTEAVLVSGVTTGLGTTIKVTLTAARLVGLPLNRVSGTRYQFWFTQGGAGAFAVTWNAAYKKTWSDTGNATGKVTTIAFIDDGTTLWQDGAQAPYV